MDQIFVATNEEFRVSAVVTKRADGRYYIALRDDDTGNYLPTVRIREDLSDARLLACAMANV
jgi:hypothetical protein